MSHNDEAALTQDQDQNGGSTKTGNPSSECKNKIIPLPPRRTALLEKLLRKIEPWASITESLQTFPYYIKEQTKALLLECVASHLKQSNFRKYRGCLSSSSDRILLQSIPGSELYRERLVRAIARELQVPLLKLNDLVFDEEDNADDDSDESDWEDDDFIDEDEDETDAKDDTKLCKLKKGNRVKYVGKAIPIEEVNDRILCSGQRGEVREVDGGKVAVLFNICGLKAKEAEKNEKSTETFQQALVTWLEAKDVKKDFDARTHDFYIALEVLYAVLESQQPVIVYFPDSFWWPPLENNILSRFQEGVVMICAENRGISESYDMLKSLIPNTHTRKPILAPRQPQLRDMRKLFTNVVNIKPPEDPNILKTFLKQIAEDISTLISEGNLCIMHKVLKDHNLSCTSLENAIVEDMLLTRENVEKIVGWATNHYLSSCPLPCVEDGKLTIPLESIKLAILRLKEEEPQSSKQSKNIKDLATNFYEKSLVSAVTHSGDIGVKFDDVGALENVKKVLYETVILPLKRPELFSRGNLLRPYKGILLFGPPGTGKTLVAKALATESGANFINITTATITSMWVGETENLSRALFSYASKLAPAIIFVDEVDSLFGLRGCNMHATSRLNEFMAAWDGLTSKESQRVLVIGATNRPFDIDEAVIRRMPRRIYVGLPDVENRSKILKILLKNENLESGFSFEQLAEATAGYSGSDLKNLCVAAAYIPIEELLEQESKDEKYEAVQAQAPALRPLNLNDFIHSKAKVRPSVSHNADGIIKLRKWNEQYGEGGSQDNGDLATNQHEKSLVSAVIHSGDIGVKFDDVGALENVKKVLYETVILPLKRPELFSRGNLLRPCKGILLFGPPGTGKTLVAKALATESGANFINITTATITSMWVGETENLTRALFSYASKLAPVIIFVDEVDSLFGVRGYSRHATSRLNEFMAAWDGLASNESQRVLVIGATNRPFDIDEAVIRRMPRRIYVGLPDVENRSKILKILLKNENLESGFSFEQLAEATAGYSGSDLKNLCVAAAYRPIEELLEQESKDEKSKAVQDQAPAPRPLNLNDFIHSKAKVRPSVSRNARSIIKLREWNEQYGEGGSQDNGVMGEDIVDDLKTSQCSFNKPTVMDPSLEDLD